MQERKKALVTSMTVSRSSIGLLLSWFYSSRAVEVTLSSTIVYYKTKKIIKRYAVRASMYLENSQF